VTTPESATGVAHCPAAEAWGMAGGGNHKPWESHSACRGAVPRTGPAAAVAPLAATAAGVREAPAGSAELTCISAARPAAARPPGNAVGNASDGSKLPVGQPAHCTAATRWVREHPQRAVGAGAAALVVLVLVVCGVVIGVVGVHEQPLDTTLPVPVALPSGSPASTDGAGAAMPPQTAAVAAAAVLAGDDPALLREAGSMAAAVAQQLLKYYNSANGYFDDAGDHARVPTRECL
jgi:hypothetical protein